MKRRKNHYLMPEEEQEVIRLHNEEGVSLINLSLIYECSIHQIQRIVRKNITENAHISYCNAWKQEEDDMLVKNLNDGFTYEYIQENLLKFRSIAAMKSRRQYLIKHKGIDIACLPRPKHYKTKK